ncbi:MAG: hypothetical protein JWM81_710 [Candidatus Saccharibacteria bacterium]|nr:hypothetical protein [Candidatus Saccharibacteria bacterium]
MKLRSNQKGFGAVELILILVIIGLIAGGGLYVLKNKDKDSDSSAKTSTSASAVPAASSSSDHAAAGSTSSANELAIKELGVKVVFTASVSDLYYQVHDSSYANISSQKLKQTDEAHCGAGVSATAPLGVGSYIDPNAPDSGAGTSTNKQAYGDGVVVSGTHYYLRKAQGACNQDAMKDGSEFTRVLGLYQGATLEKL